jgi:hypothetical protein
MPEPSLDDVVMFDGFVVLHKAIVKVDDDAAFVLFHYRQTAPRAAPEEIVLRSYRRDAHGWSVMGALAHKAVVWRDVAAAVAAVRAREPAVDPPPIASLSSVAVELRAVVDKRFVKLNDKRSVGVFLLAPNRAGATENEVMIRELKLVRGGWQIAGWFTFSDKTARDVAGAVAGFFT